MPELRAQVWDPQVTEHRMQDGAEEGRARQGAGEGCLPCGTPGEAGVSGWDSA